MRPCFCFWFRVNISRSRGCGQSGNPAHLRDFQVWRESPSLFFGLFLHTSFPQPAPTRFSPALPGHGEGVMLVKVRKSFVPSLTGPMLIDSFGVPRYWVAVWASFLPADLAEPTLEGRLRQLEHFCHHADQTLGSGRLDDALAHLDIDAISSALEAYFFMLRGQPAASSAEDRWQSALRFVTETVQRLSRGAITRQDHHTLVGRLRELELLNAHLHIGKRRRPERIRSLPSEVVEALYEMLDPESPTNPFRRGNSRWRIYTIFILLMHQGLRRGEVLNFPVDVIKCGFDRNRQETRYWMAVRYNEYEDDDPRYSKPRIKNAQSIRTVPVSKMTALIVQEYVQNYRGRPDHSFLINSQKKTPLSTEGVTKLFQKLSASLPPRLRKVLIDHTGDDSLSPHDLRHTSAVVRLNQLLASGVEMTDALQRMRGYFGWSRDSDMPLRYARAVFEDRLASVWNNAFDDRVEILRNIPKG